MSDRVLSWTLPELTARQATIAFVRVEFRVDPGLPWTVQAEVPPSGPQEVTFTNPSPGAYEYRLTIFDIFGQSGEPALASKDVPFDPPGSVANITITDV